MNDRSSKSIKNISVTMIEQILYNIFSFICRTVFIYTLGKEYLGFNGLFSDILSLLSLAELGIGTAILYSMYKPTAENNFKKISALLQYYKKLYLKIGCIIFALGICLIPFLNFFISGISYTKELIVIYILYLTNTACSYFYIYKKSILITQQKNYITSLIYTITIVTQNILQIIALIIFKNYIIYLIIQILCTLINNISISKYVDKKFPLLKEYKNEKLDDETKKILKNNIMSMFANKISSVVVTSTDNILISKFVSTITLGLYSNYTIFVSMLRNIVTKLFEAISGSIGNLAATENEHKTYSAYKNIWFGNYWLISFCIVMLFSFINPFITLWIGKEYVLAIDVVFMICLNLFLRLLRNPSIFFCDSFGLFPELKKKSIVEALSNIVFSLAFLELFNLGIFGVLLGTFASNLITNFWYEPYILYTKKFKKRLYLYYKMFFSKIGITFIIGLVIYHLINNVFIIKNWLLFFTEIGIFAIIFNVYFYIIYRKTEEFNYYKNIIIKVKRVRK